MAASCRAGRREQRRIEVPRVFVLDRAGHQHMIVALMLLFPANAFSGAIGINVVGAVGCLAAIAREILRGRERRSLAPG